MDLQQRFKKEIAPQLKKELNYNNILAIPKLEKIVVNVGLGEALTNRKVLDTVAEHIALLTGQRPLVTRAKRAISGFKLRAGRSIGLKVTLRRKRMYDFFEKLTAVVLPRLRDFRGIDIKSFDNRGNLSLGFPEYIVFPEMDTVDLEKVRGLEVTIVTTADSDEKAKILLEKLGMPFKKEVRSAK